MVVARGEIHQILVAGSHGSVPRTAARMRAFLVIVQIAMAITVLSGATLLVRSAKRLHEIDPGFDPRGTFAARIIFDDKRYANLTAAANMNERLVSAAKSIPGVQSATAVAPNALGRTVYAQVSPEDRVGEVPPQSIWLRSVGSNFTSTMGIRLVAGRDMTTADGAGAPPVVLVNQAAAEQLWPGHNPLEKTAVVDLFGDVRHMRVVGVVRNVRHVALEVSSGPEIYAAFSQAPFPSTSIVLRSGLAPASLLLALRAEVAALDARLPVPRIESLEAVVAESLASRTFGLELLTVFALMAVILSAVGTYAVAGYEVVQRTREIGIRAALGASPSRLLWMVVSQSAKSMVLGVLVGTAGAVVLTGSMRGIVFGVTTTDPWAFAAAVVPLLCVTLAASCLAALGAVRVQPSLALRSE
jgi:predicted permease